jgi:hypothetical protein
VDEVTDEMRLTPEFGDHAARVLEERGASPFEAARFFRLPGAAQAAALPYLEDRSIPSWSRPRWSCWSARSIGGCTSPIGSGGGGAGGLATLRLYGTSWFSALALRRWDRLTAEDLARARPVGQGLPIKDN